MWLHAHSGRSPYSHFRHVLTLLKRQWRDTAYPIGLQALQHGRRAPASRRASSQGGRRRQAEQDEHQRREERQGPGSHIHLFVGSIAWEGSRSWCLRASPNEELMKSGGELPHTALQLVRVWWGATAVLSSRRGRHMSRLKAPGDMLVVGWSFSSLPPSLLVSFAIQGGATY